MGHAPACTQQPRRVQMAYCCSVAAVTPTTCRWCVRQPHMCVCVCSHATHLQADVFGLARHRDGRWEWAAAPVVAPTPRYQACPRLALVLFFPSAACVTRGFSRIARCAAQHAAACIGARLHVSGGALGGGKMVRARVILRPHSSDKS